MRKSNVRLILTIAMLVIALADIGIYIYFGATGVLASNRRLAVLFAILTPICVLAFFLLFIWFRNEYTLVKSMRAENVYNFGEPRNFYNYQYFEKECAWKRFFMRGSQYIIAFTSQDYNVMRNTSRNDLITVFSNEITHILSDELHHSKTFKRSDTTFCYYHGVFLIYVWGDEEKVRNIIDLIEQRLYRLPEEKHLRVFVQPFFGLYRFEDPRKEDIYIAVDNAIAARNTSERNFESVTYYASNIRQSTTIEEIDEISKALEEKEFVVYYQPKFSLVDKVFNSSEALVRWNSKKYGFLNPAKFISKAEYGGLIHEIDMFVFRRVCEDLNDSRRRGRRILPVSVNFSLYEFYSPDFVDDLMKILEENKVPTNLVQIEVTETTSQSNPFLSISIMKKLRDRGFRILMDDFGVGFSNFNNLKKMPLDTIKIDKSFIDEITIDNKSREIVKFLISLCRVNGMEVVAEGVDNAEQVEILKRAHCDTIQGYYYSKPLSKVEYDKFLLNNPFEKKGATSE